MRSRKGSAFIILFLIMTAVIEGPTSECLGMQDETEELHAKSRSIVIDHETPSIGTGAIIGNHHRIEIEGSIQGDEGEGELRLDSGRTKLNEFGDIIPHHGHLATAPIKFKLLDRIDPTGRGRRNYLIIGGGFERLGIECSIVMEKNAAVRLIIKDGEERTALPLTPRIKQ